MQRDPKSYRDFEFNLRELAGSMGDFGTLFPLAIGLIAVNGMDPTGLFVMLGLTNIATGLIYRMPMPVEPKKVISAAAIAQGWPASVVVASGLGLGLSWLAIAATRIVRRLVSVTPVYIVRGIQLALGVGLALGAWQMSASEVWLMATALAVILVSRRSPYFPSALVIMALGVGIMAVRGDLAGRLVLSLSLPEPAVPKLEDVWRGLMWAGFAQIPLTLTNAVLATATMIRAHSR